MARERRLEARDVEAIFREFAKVMSELPPETEAGWLVISHGVGPIRKYCIGAFLLDPPGDAAAQIG